MKQKKKTRRIVTKAVGKGKQGKRKDGIGNQNQAANRMITDNEGSISVNRTYKDALFRLVFRDKKELLSLYNALNDSHYTKEEELTIVTLENAIYMSMKNDLAFVLDMRLNMYEHQSTHNPNIPLRNLFYVSKEYQTLVEKKTLYGSKKVKIPAPRFVVFYNGVEEQPERQWLKLSDLYEIPEDDPMLELKVLVLNINHGKNEEIKEKCHTLKEYMLYVEKVRYYIHVEKKSLQEAIEIAVEECIKENILADFLRKNRAEVIEVSIFEYDEEKELRLIRESEREYGIEIGTERGIEIGTERGIEIGTERGIEIGTERGIEIGTERGTEKERDKNIKIIMKKMNLTKVEAMKFLEIPTDI